MRRARLGYPAISHILPVWNGHHHPPQQQFTVQRFLCILTYSLVFIRVYEDCTVDTHTDAQVHDQYSISDPVLHPHRRHITPCGTTDATRDSHTHTTRMKLSTMCNQRGDSQHLAPGRGRGKEGAHPEVQEWAPVPVPLLAREPREQVEVRS